jgi:predicted MFS family arabinose efflux permease
MISPKVYIPLVFAIVAAFVIFLWTGDNSYLVAILVSLAAGGAGVAAKPAPQVSQREVNDLSRQKRGLIRGSRS